MPGQIRSNPEAMKIVYELCQTPEELRQNSKEKVSRKTIEAWEKDSDNVR